MCTRSPVCGSSRSTRTPTSIDERPAQFTIACSTTTSPWRTGAWNDRLSIDAVTTLVRAKRWAETAAQTSIQAITWPPKTVPRALA